MERRPFIPAVRNVAYVQPQQQVRYLQPLPAQIPVRVYRSNILDRQEVVQSSSNLPASKFTPLLSTQYLIGDEIGSGSFAKVYAGVDRKTGQKVAIKKIDRKKFDSNHIGLIDSEIAVLSQLNNEYIIRFLDFFDKGDFIYVITELCELGDLEQFIAKNFRATHNQLPELLVKIFSYQILLAFLGIVDINIIHRDMKLSNVLINKHLRLKIADFGFAKSSTDRQSEQAGTPLTMAPEVLNNQDYSSPCDVWSVGCMIYEMLEGRGPFAPRNGGGIAELKALIKQRRIIYTNPNISPAAKDLIDKMLTINPNHRINWHAMFNHEWFAADCLEKGESLIQEVSNKYLAYIDFEEKHLDPAFANYFGFVIQDFVNYSVDKFLQAISFCSKQLSIIKTFLPKFTGYITNIQTLLLDLVVCLYKSPFQFEHEKNVYTLQLTNHCKNKIVATFPEVNQILQFKGNQPNQNASDVSNNLTEGLLKFSEAVLETNFEIFKEKFAPIINLVQMMHSKQFGIIQKIELEQNSLSKDEQTRLILINIPKAYANEKTESISNFKKSIIMNKTVHTNILHNPHSDLLDRLLLLSDIVFGYLREVSQ